MASRILSLRVVACLLSLAVANAEGPYGSDGQAFQQPPVRARPFFRYWLPDASVDGSVLARDIANAGAVGAGGIELVPFYQYGLYAGRYPPGANWTRDGFGTPSYNALFKRALEAHEKAGLVMDFAIGPNQGQGVPADPGDDGLQWDLSPSARPLSPGQGLYGTVPGWGTGKLFALVSAIVVSRENATTVPDFLTPTPIPYTKLVVRSGSIVDLTHKVAVDGRVGLPPRETPDGAETWVFAFYERRSLRQNVVFPNNETRTIWDNGSYTVDHFSPRGARTMIKFWEEYMLKDKRLASLVKRAGQYGWEDSPEIVANITWTTGLPGAFKKLHGYDIKTILPFLMWGNNNLGVQAGNPGRLRVLDERAAASERHQNNYRATLEVLYREYLTALSAGLHKSLGVGLRTQVSYNLPMDMAANVPFVDVPECESLGFRDSIDAYRQYAGPAVLGGRNIISNEMGAVLGRAYQYTMPMLLYSANRAFAGGSNRMVLHAQGYTGRYYGTTWPGYTGFQYAFSESFTNKHPAWENGMADTMGYLARTQYTQQAGTARIDIAIYHRTSATNLAFPVIYTHGDLVDAGFSYVYLTADNFNLPQARVRDRVLAPDGPSFKALVLTNESSVTLDAVRHLTRYARAGLPVILAGTPSPYLSGRTDAEVSEVTEALAKLTATPGVHQSSPGKLSATLEALRIEPNVRVRANGTWHTTFRQDAKAGLDYIFILGDESPSSGAVTVRSSGVPYLFDAWTGRRTAILHYTRGSNGAMTIPLVLAGNQTRIIAISPRPLRDVPTPAYHITALPETVLGYRYSPQEGLRVQLGAGTPSLRPPSSSSSSSSSSSGSGGGDSATGAVVLSDGRRVNVTAPPPGSAADGVPAPFALTRWTLTAEHWEAPADMYDVSVVARKRNATHELTAPLLSWTELGPQLANASGVGYYRAHFTWPPAQGGGGGGGGGSCSGGSGKRSGRTGGGGDGDNSGAVAGAYLVLDGEVLHTLRVRVNGRALLPVDLRAPRIDIGPYLRRGDNEVLVVVPTTMWNYVRSIFPSIRNAGDPPLKVNIDVSLPVPGPSRNGLLGTVTVVPYREVRV